MEIRFLSRLLALFLLSPLAPVFLCPRAILVKYKTESIKIERPPFNLPLVYYTSNITELPKIKLHSIPRTFPTLLVRLL